MRGFFLMFAWLARSLADGALRGILWRAAIVVVALVLLAGWGGFAAADALFALWSPGAEGALGDLVQWAMELGKWLVALAVGWVAFVIAAPLSTSLWSDAIVARVAERLQSSLPTHGAGGWRQWVGTLALAVRPWLRVWRWWLAAFVLFWLPGIGPAASAAALGWAGAQALVFELMDAAASRLGWDWQKREAAFRARRWDWIGLGLAALLLTGTLFGAMLVPVAGVAAATELILERRSKEEER